MINDSAGEGLVVGMVVCWGLEPVLPAKIGRRVEFNDHFLSTYQEPRHVTLILCDSKYSISASTFIGQTQL